MRTPPLRLRAIFGLGLAVIATLLAIPESRAQFQNPAPPLVVPPPLIPPPLSVPRVQFFENNPAAWSQFLSQLPPRPAGPLRPTAHRALPPIGGTWQAVNNFLPGGVYISNPLLLTDGTVIAENEGTPEWYKLTPDINGSYLNGTWSQIASMPVINGTQYAPLYYASAVLPDGRVIVMGGEYNAGVGDHTNLGAIYDPLANTWTAVSPPTGAAWFAIGDAQSAVLPNGTFMLAACCAGPTADALFNATTLSWTSIGGPSVGSAYAYQDEQGYNLLPNGSVLTIDIWDDYPNAGTTNTWQYVPSSGMWITAANTPVPLSDCNWEIGPAVLRADGTLVAFGAISGCMSGPTTDPTAIYDSNNGTWSPATGAGSSPNVPAVCGSGTTSCTLADAPAALLPNGNALFAASAWSGAPTHFFEFTSATSASPNTINQVADTVYLSGTSVASSYNFLVLPNGQIFSTDFSNAPEFYTPTGSANASWAPVISSAPSAIYAGATYPISGSQFNGLSQGAYFGDDVQGASNYPIVQITNSVTGHVFYARTFDHSTMSIAPRATGSTNFTVPENVETGPSNLVVIANGIASEPVSVAVQHSGYAKPPNFNSMTSADSDILWRNTDGQAYVWLMNSGTASSEVSLGVVSEAWKIVGTGDFNGDGNTDILWRNANGQVEIWFMNGGTHTGTANLGVVPNAWTIVGTGDFNGDGTSDILWRNANGQAEIWFIRGGTRTGIANLGVIPTSWTVVGTGDFNHDGTSDILWRNANGQVEIWFISAGTRTGIANLGVVSNAWTIVGTGDFNHDGTTDILWHNANGQVEIWIITGAGIHSSSVSLGAVSNTWSIAATSDFNGDGTSDILWRDSNGQAEIWFITVPAPGGTITHSSSASLGVLSNAWTIVQ